MRQKSVIDLFLFHLPQYYFIVSIRIGNKSLPNILFTSCNCMELQLESLNKAICFFLFIFVFKPSSLFLCLRYEVAGGIMFSGCPSVRLYRLYVHTSPSRDRVI